MSKRIEYDDGVFRKLWADGVSCGKIAKHFGSSKSAISIHAARLGLRPRLPGFVIKTAPVIADSQAFKDVWASKLSYAQIGETLGCSGDTVKRAGVKYGYPKRNLRPAPVAKPKPKPREGVRQAAVMTAQSSINESSVGLVSLRAEPWASPDDHLPKAPRAAWCAKVAKLAGSGCGTRDIAKRLLCPEIDVVHELVRNPVCQVAHD